MNGQLSQDMRWVAYESNEGERFEIVVQQFPNATAKWQISLRGGMMPRWRADGKELFYVASDGALMGAPITVAPDGKTLQPGAPVPLVRNRIVFDAYRGVRNSRYAVTPDGQRFLMIVPAEGAVAPVVLFLNWAGGCLEVKPLLDGFLRRDRLCSCHNRAVFEASHPSRRSVMRTPGTACLVVVLFLASAPRAFAQASITGTVRDSSGAVLPGVTVEASSAALIEKVRTATTDGNGQFRIVDLRAGDYAVTFSLAGFTTVKREGIALEGSFTATINAEMRVGELTETITVTGESPIVDVQSVRRQMVLDNDIISAIPSSRSYNNLIQLMPNSVNQAAAPTDVQVVPGMVVFGGLGGRSNEGRVNVDGLSVGSAFNGAGVSSYIADVANAREIAMTISGGLGETEGGGPSLNVLPKEGGNALHGTFFAAGSTSGMIGSNYTQELRDLGLTTPGETRKVWDFNLGIGGPVAKDRVWYYFNLREEGSERTVPGMFANTNAGDPTKWTYVADTNRPVVLAASYRITALRLTAQATPRNKFAVFWDQQLPCEGGAASGYSGDACRTSPNDFVYAGSTAAPTPSASAVAAPETAGYRDYGNRVSQAKWTSPVNNRLLLEAGFGMYRSRYGGGQIPGLPTEDLIRVVEQCAPSCANNGNIPGLSYRSLNWFSNVNWNNSWNAAASLVTGSHNIKFGYQGGLLIDQRKNFGNNQYINYRTNNAIPDQITLNINRFDIRQSVRFDSFYAQEQWTLGRMTVQGALRYDHAWSYFPEQTVGPVRFFPTAVTYPRTTGVEGYHDLWPRGGVAYDLFGTGKTSVKVNFGRYLEAAQNGGLFIALNPTGRLSTTTTRTWTDTNRNYVADCNLSNPAAQDVSASGGDVCGANASPNFGTEVFDSTLDPGLLSGWGVRSGDWQWGASVQHEVLPRVAVEFGYQRRWLVNSLATDNRARSAADHTAFGLNIPSDPRLPGGGGGVLDGLYNVTPEAAARLNDNYQTLSSNIGDWTQVAHGLNLNVTARMRNSLVLQGVFGTGTSTNDYCDIRSTVPEWTVLGAQSPTNPWCDTSSGWVTRATALGSYTIPKVEVQVSGTFRSEQGGQLAANWTAPNSATVGLNRPFAGLGSQTITVNLIEPGTLYGERVNQIDMRFAKILRFGRSRTTAGFDVYNLTNSNAVLTYNQIFSPTTTTWLRPNSVLQARFVKFSAQVDF